MDVEKVKEALSERLPKKRLDHVIRVTETAKCLAEKYNVSVTKAEQAALLHDIAKYMEEQLLKKIMLEQNIDSRLFLFHHELWHAPVGAVIARDEFNVKGEDILNAIRYHTTGRAGMTDLEKVIYVADMIEPGRVFPGVETLREKAQEDLNVAMGACIHHLVQFLVSKKVALFPDSIDCYNEYTA